MNIDTPEKLKKTIPAWEGLCVTVTEIDFEPVTMEPPETSIRFEYSSKRESIWTVCTAVSLVLAIGLAAIFSIPFGFLITGLFVILTKTTDDYLLLDSASRAFHRVQKFAGRTQREHLIDVDDARSVQIVPTIQNTGSTNWTEYWIEIESKSLERIQVLTHPDSRSKLLARRLGKALADYMKVPLITSEEKP